MRCNRHRMILDKPLTGFAAPKVRVCQCAVVSCGIFYNDSLKCWLLVGEVLGRVGGSFW